MSKDGRIYIAAERGYNVPTQGYDRLNWVSQHDVTVISSPLLVVWLGFEPITSRSAVWRPTNWCRSVWLTVWLSVWLSVWLHVWLSVCHNCLSVCLTDWPTVCRLSVCQPLQLVSLSFGQAWPENRIVIRNSFDLPVGKKFGKRISFSRPKIEGDSVHRVGQIRAKRKLESDASQASYGNRGRGPKGLEACFQAKQVSMYGRKKATHHQ